MMLEMVTFRKRRCVSKLSVRLKQQQEVGTSCLLAASCEVTETELQTFWRPREREWGESRYLLAFSSRDIACESCEKHIENDNLWESVKSRLLSST